MEAFPPSCFPRVERTNIFANQFKAHVGVIDEVASLAKNPVSGRVAIETDRNDKIKLIGGCFVVRAKTNVRLNPRTWKRRLKNGVKSDAVGSFAVYKSSKDYPK